MFRNAVVLISLVSCNMAIAETVVIGNSSFEDGSYPLIIAPVAGSQTTIPGPGSAVPEGLKGGWGHNDGTRFVAGESGITPYDGNQMLKFVTTGYPGPDFTTGGEAWKTRSYTGISSDIVQLIDLSSSSASIAQGNAVLTASVWLNRVAVSDDSLFRLSLWAFSGPFGDLDSVANTPDPTLLTYADLFSDANSSTWERLSLSIPLAPQTTFVRLGISAVENGTSNVYPEFAGHYADAVTAPISQVPLPASIWLMASALGALGLVGRRGKTSRPAA